MSHNKLLHIVQATLPTTVAVVAPHPEHIKHARMRPGQIPPCGAGVIIDATNGIIITNNHVIEGGDPNHLEVITYDNVRRKAKLIGRSPTADVAVLQIAPYDGIVAAPIGDSDTLLAGQVAYAIGTPRGLMFSVSAGVVSHPNRFQRSLVDDDDETGSPSALPSIQHDAACNPGNSGGGLFDIEGNLIGINTFILTAPVLNQKGEAVAAALGSIGLGMALQINAVMAVAGQILKAGGAQIGDQPMFRLMRGARGDRVSLTPPTAVLTAVTESAKRAGLKNGDTLLQVNGTDVLNSWHGEALLVVNAGKAVTLTVRGRNGNLRTAELTLPRLTVLSSLCNTELAEPRRELGYLQKVSSRRRPPSK